MVLDAAVKPHVIVHMLTSIDGRIHPSRYTESSDGGKKEWSAAYEKVHETLAGDAWLVGRVTMAEMSKGEPKPAAGATKPSRPTHFSKRDAGVYAITFDRSGKLHFSKPDIGGDHVVVLLGPRVTDAHLAELVANGVSYVVAEDEAMAAKPLFELLNGELGIKRLLVEGGGKVNGALLAEGVVDELSVLIAPALDGAPNVTGVAEVPDEKGLAGKARLRFTSSEPLPGGLVHLRYAVETH